MSRFNLREVNENWDLHIDGAGRKVKGTYIEGRWVQIFESDLKDADGNFPIRERYLLNIGIPVIVDDVMVEVKTLWVTKRQMRTFLKLTGRGWERGGVEDLAGIIAKFFDHIGEDIKDWAEGKIVEEIINIATDKINDDVLTKDRIKDIVMSMLEMIKIKF